MAVTTGVLVADDGVDAPLVGWDGMLVGRRVEVGGTMNGVPLGKIWLMGVFVSRGGRAVLLAPGVAVTIWAEE